MSFITIIRHVTLLTRSTNIYIKIKNNFNTNIITKFVTKDTINSNSTKKSDSEFEFTIFWYLKRKFNLYFSGRTIGYKKE